MSLAVVRSRALLGLQAPLVTVEVHLANGLPAFSIVGLPQAEVRESRDRVRAALQHLGFKFPNRRITVNLAPADLPKASGRFDLPIALGILGASDQLARSALDAIEAVGELSLTGEIRPIRGALALALAIKNAGQNRLLMLPADNAAEAGLVPGIRLIAPASLLEAKSALTSKKALNNVSAYRPNGEIVQQPSFDGPDLADVRGQQQAKRALEIAAAGGHNVLMVGPPGTGKTLLALRFASLLPPLTLEEAIETAAIASLDGRFSVQRWLHRPVTAPHHSASAVALVGGGSPPRPGEISLAHNGVLFLDELPEFPAAALEALREPMECGTITIARAARHTEFPARFQLIAAMNPCPCGYLGHPYHSCRCTPDQVARYQGRLSGPFLDRIDISIEVGAVRSDELLADGEQRAPVESSFDIAQRVQACATLQRQRQQSLNARLTVAQLPVQCPCDRSANVLLSRSLSRLNWSARAYHRVLRIARTIADLDRAQVIGGHHAAEAVQLRRALRTH